MASSFSLSHFQSWVQRLEIDTGQPLEVEEFQLEYVKPILDGVKETWIVIPEANGKTTFLAAVALYHCAYTRAPWVPIAASSRDQAEILARQAYHMIRATGLTDSYFKIYEGYREIRSLRTGGRGIKVYAADAATGDGVIPTLAICDEGHRWPDLALYRLWKGKLNKRAGQIVMISTAGEPGSDFEETRDRIRDSLPRRERHGSHLRAWGRNIEFHEWQVGREADVLDMAAVKDANPFSFITEESLYEESPYVSPTTDLGDWKRLKCNVPSRSTAAAITEAEWDGAESDRAIPPGEHIDVGVDVAWKHDTFAITPLWRDEGFMLLGDPIILQVPADGSMLSVDVVKVALEDLNSRNPIDMAAIDIERAEDVAQWMTDELHIEVVDRDQGNAAACEDYEVFMRGLRAGSLRHTGHPGLRRHAMNAIARTLPGDKRRFDRPSQSRARKRQTVRVIDALTASAMIVQVVSTLEPPPSEPLVAWR